MSQQATLVLVFPNTEVHAFVGLCFFLNLDVITCSTEESGLCWCPLLPPLQVLLLQD